jgi:lysyl-tRNA synthetase class 2
MQVSINHSILNAFPHTAIGIVVASFNNAKASPVVEELKKQLPALTSKQGITKNHANIVAWQEVYRTFGVNPKECRSSVEALVRRIVDNKGIWNISPAVDIYNCASVLSVMPMGAYDLDKVANRNIEIRFGKAGESFIPLGKTEPIPVKPEHIVYATGQAITTWLWNHKDAHETCVDKDTKHAIFFIDSTKPSVGWNLEETVDFLADCMVAIGGYVHQIAFLDQQQTTVTIEKTLKTSPERQLSFEELLARMPLVEASTEVKKNTGPEVRLDASQEHELRKAKVAAMAQEGISAWPAYQPVSHTTTQALNDFKATNNLETTYAIAGRMITRRDHGKTFFANIQDRDGKMQLYIKKDDIGTQAFEEFKKHTDLGDILWASGSLFVTKTGEVTMHVKTLQLLSKCLHPLPEKFHGLTDVEQRYRQRYLDMIANHETREKFKKRSGIIHAIRGFLQNQDFLEVETPMLHPIPGGAAARPFVTHHNAYNMDLFLRIAPELYLKRLVIGGFERVFEINRNFRNEGVSTRHNPEFTMLEFYMAHGDVQSGIDLTQQLLQDVVEKNFGTHQIPFQGKVLDFTSPFKQLTVEESLIQIGGLKAHDFSPEHITATLAKHPDAHVRTNASHGEKLFALFEACVEQKIVQPTFIVGYPIEVSPLSKRDPKNPSLAARFELFICGMEFANGFTELNDPFDQAERFKAQVNARSHGDSEAHHYDADYIKALEFGLPPTVGVGIGIDRLVMVLTDTASIKDVILFPTLKIAHE